MATAVIISNMGGPDSLDAVEPYLFNIFKDPDIIDIPLPESLRIRFVRWLARKRADESKEIYRKIGGLTPLIRITERQADRLQKSLNALDLDEFHVFPAMRYWHPFVEDVWQKVLDQNFERIIVLTLYPFYSTTTTGSLENLVLTLNKQSGIPDDRLLIIDRFGNHPTFIEAMAEQINRDLRKRAHFYNGKPAQLMFSAHSIPMRRIRKGDPYRDEIEKAVQMLRTKLPENVNIHLCFQSKLGPIKWLEPATDELIDELAEEGIDHLIVYPLGFVTDNSETLYEIGMLYRDQAVEKGIKNFYRIAALNVKPLFIKTLTEVVSDRYREKFGVS